MPITTLSDLRDKNNYKASQSTTQGVSNGDNQSSTGIRSFPRETPSVAIDVIKDYDWTHSTNKIRKTDEVPYLYAKEFKMAGNSYISSLMTSALLFPDLADSNVGAEGPFNSFWEKIKGSFKDNKFAEFISSNASDVTQKLSEKVTPYINWVADQVKAIDQTAEAWNNPDLQKKYAYLYIRKPTNTSYYFPYFENDYISIKNGFEDTYKSGTDTKNPFLKVMENASKLASDTAEYANAGAATEPGSYIQRPKFYNFEDSGISYKSTFYLFNTLKEDSYVKNLELITKLTVQNTPHRHNRILVDPPCIYELTVPGRGFYPYTYISNLTVDFVGTRRMITSERGNRVIVPDAFKVTIEFKSLTMEVNNFIIPEMGDAGIDVSQRFGLRLNPDIPLPEITTKKSEEAKPQPNPAENNTGARRGSTGATLVQNRVVMGSTNFSPSPFKNS